ncbi:hypothetical protein CEP49_05895 [Mergibacter septicus]|uniref:DarT ssDNA thymidine ADP-ribosyltransferase family protein n=1 Tax=Mergibacter septicus TaxID=221402 RepID=UPI0011798787|nr:DarT ssDNA thymidine ADP-ribosyltransferase family protein [Mergibacter septicus]AWX14113.1 hypothetical protein CEP49_05895 [Mergibacter septicus]
MMDSNLSIAKFIKQRNIKWLCHFTPRANLENIKKEGLKPRDLINYQYVYTDAVRYDTASNSICLSISQPNNWMLSKKIEDGLDLCLLLINPSILYEKNCLFYPHNAATKSYKGLPIEQFKGIEALKKLFDDEITYQKSGLELQTIFRYDTKSFLTTSEQAEVQCLEIIETKYIDYIIENDILLDYEELESKITLGEIKPFGIDRSKNSIKIGGLDEPKLP